MDLIPNTNQPAGSYFNSFGGVIMTPADHAKWVGFHLKGAMGGAPAACPVPWTAPCIDSNNMATLHTNLPGPGGPTGAAAAPGYAMAW